MVEEWEINIKRQIKRMVFEIRDTKVFCVVHSDHVPMADFECDAQDITGIKNLLIKHGVLEA